MQSDKNKGSSNYELKAAREKMAEDLLATKYGDPSHAALEARFNEIEKQLQGNPKDYIYKYDVRHHFDFQEIVDPADHTKMTQIATMAVKPDGTLYTILPPARVINWRKTDAGKSADAKNRGSKSRLSLDDAGHLIALEYGASPSEPGNIADQNYIQNEWGTWRAQERALREFVESHENCRVRVEVNYFKDRFGQRSLYWRMEASDGNNIKLNDNVRYLNTRSDYEHRSQGSKHMAAIRGALAERQRKSL